MKYICWNEPLWGPGNTILGNSIVKATEEDIIKWKRGLDSRYDGVQDSDIINEFLVVNWAWEEDHEI